MAKEKRGFLEPVYHPETIRNDELAEEIASLSAQMQNADYRLLVLIREFDEKGVCDPNELRRCPEGALRTEQQTVA